ncbi:sulfur carrier protein ThiS [Streptomyces sp. TRM43335]|uniref:Sulfur carrier protein ThiS n=1 Tax=Streptomyces taklimakanensis TaxID=2569853 RepID=A0A6G2B8R1_9ACTN|nr:sulfur carrier protein ThiS [Streptomyces taklimakanensis]MTE18665.1 sulfur carrier protein ThiS [Streptomyces taklimakanensis]
MTTRASAGAADTTTDTANATTSAAATVTVTVNGEPAEVVAGLTLDRLVASLTSAATGVAAAVNETVVPRGQWPTTELVDGDRVEVLTAVQGG